MRFFLACFVFLAFTQSALATNVSGTFDTIISDRQDTRAGDTVSVIPLYELVSLEVGNLRLPGTDSARLVMQGWGRLELGHDTTLNPNSADLGLLYLQAQKGPAVLRVGRQYVLLGAGRAQMLDGGELTLALPAGFRLEGYGGATIQQKLHFESGAWLAGARLAKSIGTGEIGIDYGERRHNNDIYRQEVGADGFYLIGPVRVLGLASMSTTDSRLMEARLAATYTYRKNILITVDGERVAPDLFLDRQSIFSVFAEENHDSYGGDVLWTPSPYYDVGVEGHVLLLSGYLGYDATVKATTYREASHRSRIGIEAGREYQKDNAFTKVRLWTYLQVLKPLALAAEAYGYYFDKNINTVKGSGLAAVNAIYEFTPSMRLIGSVTGGSTTLAKAEVEGLLRFAYGFDAGFGREVKP
jgi:hypothetical protein